MKFLSWRYDLHIFELLVRSNSHEKIRIKCNVKIYDKIYKPYPMASTAKYVICIDVRRTTVDGNTIITYL